MNLKRLFFGIWLGVQVSSCTSPKPQPVPQRPEVAVPGENYNFRPSRISYSRVATNQPVLAMTFDDGPHPVLTPKLLDILKQRNVKATFFVVGTNARAYPGIIRRMIAEGHEVANHTWNHASLLTRSDEQIYSDLKNTDNAVVAGANYRMRLMRPPYGAVNERIKALMYQKFGYITAMWSVDPLDWKRPGSGVVASRLIQGAHPGAIMLAHDIHAGTIEAMPAVFDQLQARGYKFVTVSQLLRMENSGGAGVVAAARPVSN